MLVLVLVLDIFEHEYKQEGEGGRVLLISRWSRLTSLRRYYKTGCLILVVFRRITVPDKPGSNPDYS